MADERSAWPAGYLRGERYGLRAPIPADAESAGAWYEGVFPISSDTARNLLAEHETLPWGSNPMIRLMVVALATGTVVGGVLVDRTDNRVSKLIITAGDPDRAGSAAQWLRAETLGLLVPWVFGELGMMTAAIDIPADEPVMIAAAQRLGFVEAARLREHIARPQGRVALLMLERIDRQWGRGNA